MPVITVASLKGGCGKTTTSINLATGLTSLKRSVVLIEADPQASGNTWAEARGDDEPLPFPVVQAARKTLHRDIDQLQGNYEFAIIDTPPRTSAITRSALITADILLMPVKPSSFDVWALEETFQSIEEIQVVNEALEAYFMVSMAIVGSKSRNETKSLLADYADKGKLLNTVIHQRESFARVADGGTIAESKDGKALTEVMMLTREVIKLLNDSKGGSNG